MKYPITVNEIKWKEAETWREKLLFGGSCGDFVAVRPCAEKFESRTFLGILLGEFPLSVGAQLDPTTGTLTIARCTYNPAIFIPDKAAVVFGASSWWGRIKDQAQLREITDGDIQNVWYVKALKQIIASENPTS